MSELRAISPIKSASALEDWRGRAGKPPYLAFIALDKLRVETAYQRMIGGKGAVNVRAIVRDFRWSRFAPLIVAPLPGDKYAVIDGQHRACALATLGEKAAPCVVYEIDFAARADAFAAHNIAVTALTPQARYYALLGAGEAAAVAADAVLKKHGIEVLKYNLATAKMTGRQSVCASAFLGVVKQYGAEVLDLAIEMLVGHPDFNSSFLTQRIIRAVAMAIFEDARLFNSRATIEAFREFDLDAEIVEAADASRGRPGVSATTMLKIAVKTFLQKAVLDQRRAG